jgi:hypothetical protein
MMGGEHVNRSLLRMGWTWCTVIREDRITARESRIMRPLAHGMAVTCKCHLLTGAITFRTTLVKLY